MSPMGSTEKKSILEDNNKLSILLVKDMEDKEGEGSSLVFTEESKCSVHTSSGIESFYKQRPSGKGI